MPHRILMIAPTSFFGDYGCHVRILEETLALQKLGHQVLIVTYPRGRDMPGLRVERTMPIPWRVDYEVGSSRHKLGLDLFLGSRVLRAARRFRPDIIHAHLHEGALIGALASRLFNAPLVFDFQGSLTAEMADHHFLKPKGPVFQGMRLLEDVINRFPSAILTSSQNGIRVLTEQFKVPSHKIVPIPDAVDPERFVPTWILEQQAHQNHFAEAKSFIFGIPQGRPIVVYLGLMADYQGVGVLVEAAAQLIRRGVNAHFLLMGYPGADRYIARVHALGISKHVSFPGRIPYEDAPRWLALGDIAVAPKMSSTEGNGKILNYMATGLPVVAFDNPVSREYLGDQGIYAPSGSVDGLAQGLERLLSEQAQARSLGQQLRARAVDKFAWEFSARKIEQVYDGLLHPNPARAPTPTDISMPASQEPPTTN